MNLATVAPALIPVLLATCGTKGPDAMPDVPPAIQAIAPAPRQVEYTRVNYAGEIPLPTNRIREVWEGPKLEGGVLVYDVVSWDITKEDPGSRLSGDRVFYGPEGYGFLGTFEEDGSFEPWEPPQIVLPRKPKIGATWSETHTKGDATSERSCEILASDYCDGGLVVVCESKRSGGVIVLRDHFCAEWGWKGFEALVQAGNQPSVRMWSEELVKDGRAAPEPAVEE